MTFRYEVIINTICTYTLSSLLQLQAYCQHNEVAGLAEIGGTTGSPAVPDEFWLGALLLIKPVAVAQVQKGNTHPFIKELETAKTSGISNSKSTKTARFSLMHSCRRRTRDNAVEGRSEAFAKKIHCHYEDQALSTRLYAGKVSCPLMLIVLLPPVFAHFPLMQSFIHFLISFSLKRKKSVHVSVIRESLCYH